MQVIAIRHGQSLANAGLEASLNSDLSPLGRQQVQRLAERFRGVKIRAIYASPLNRCLQTALPIAEAVNQSIRVRAELFEFHGLEPGARVDLPLHHPGEFTTRTDGIRLDDDHPPVEAWPRIDESRQDMIDRTRAMTRYLIERWPAKDDAVIVVSHGSPIARLIDAWLTDQSGPSFRFVIENATVNTMRFHEGVRSLICLNEASHLAGLNHPHKSNIQVAW